MKSVFWFRDDLRIQDNRSLHRCSKESESILGIYVIDPSIWAGTQFGIPRMGSFRRRFLLECLADLDHQIRTMGGRLIILHGSPEKEIPNIVRSHGFEKVFASAGYTWEEKNMEQEIKRHVHLEIQWNGTLTDPHSLPFEIHDLPDVFTSFRKKVEKYGSFWDPVSMDEPIPWIDLPEVGLSVDEIEFEAISPDHRAVMDFVGGEGHGWKRLNHYIHISGSVAHYKETRNAMLGADNSSKFSPWLASGCISPRQVANEVQRFEEAEGATESTYWMIFELLWRDFFKFAFLKYGPKLFQPKGIGNRMPPLAHDERFDLWCEGKTGDDLVDANMIELQRTGFMSNRGRQNVASYLVHDLEQDWRLGASWMEYLLIDHDPASNWGNWAYVAGVGHDPRNRKFNTQLQSERYDPDMAYRRTWLSL
ncbi:MAG: DASH family cryptochrome [Bacteroidota bacterium]|nr:DASH family cryptochrome [Bacteroidota bacterium]